MNNVHFVNYDQWTGQPVYIDLHLTGKAVPFNIAMLMAGRTGPEVLQNILGMRENASQQVSNPFDQAAIAEKQAYWERWVQFPKWWLPLTAQTNFVSSNISLFNITTAATTMFFNSNDVFGAFAGPNGQQSAALSVAGQSFYASDVNAPLYLILPLSVDNPLDGSSFNIYLVPDDGTGGTDGIAGNPTASVDDRGNFVSFTNAQLIVNVPDSSLPMLPEYALNTYSVIPSIETQNNIYWICIVFPSDSTGECYYSSSVECPGSNNQNTTYVQYNGPLQVFTDPLSGGMFQFIIYSQQ